MKLKDLVVEMEKAYVVETIEISTIEHNILEMAILFDQIDNGNNILTEGAILDMLRGKLDGMTDKLKGWGFEFHNTKPGLISTMAKGGKTVIKVLLIGIAATQAKASGDTEKLELLKVEANAIKDSVQAVFTQQNVVDLLLQLDTATAHLVTGPIHMFGALTGIHIVLPWEGKEPSHSSHHAGEQVGIADIIASTIQSLRDKVAKTFNPDKTQQIHAALDTVNALIAKV